MAQGNQKIGCTWYRKLIVTVFIFHAFPNTGILFSHSFCHVCIIFKKPCWFVGAIVIWQKIIVYIFWTTLSKISKLSSNGTIIKMEYFCFIIHLFHLNSILVILTEWLWDGKLSLKNSISLHSTVKTGSLLKHSSITPVPSPCTWVLLL